MNLKGDLHSQNALHNHNNPRQVLNAHLYFNNGQTYSTCYPPRQQVPVKLRNSGNSQPAGLKGNVDPALGLEQSASDGAPDILKYPETGQQAL